MGWHAYLYDGTRNMGLQMYVTNTHGAWGGVHEVKRAGHRQGGGVGGCSSGAVCEINIVGSEFPEGLRTHTLFEYPLGKPSFRS